MASEIRVLIVGAGLGGLALGCCLERAGIQYEILERSPFPKALGSALVLTANAAPMLRQLGLYEAILRASKAMEETNVLNEEGTQIGSIPFGNEYTSRYGYPGLVIGRADLHNILLRQIPREKIRYGKRVLNIHQTNDGVIVRCQDGTKERADILVGADGAYSGVRQSMYRDLKENRELPKSDDQLMKLTSACLVGTTWPLNPNVFPQILEDRAYMDVSLGENKPFQWCLFTLPDNRIAWMVLKDIKTSTDDSEAFKYSEWGTESTEEMLAESKDLPIPWADRTMQYLYDRTDAKLISKVLLEQKLFDTWYDRRTVLIGDACHKMSPVAGQSAVQAFLDAGSLSSYLNDLPDSSPKSILQAFQAYKEDRYPIANEAVKTSKNFTKIFGSSDSWSNNLTRSVRLKLLPKFADNLLKDKLGKAKAQINFLPFVPDRGTIRAIPQKQSNRMAGAPQYMMRSSRISTEVWTV